MNPSTPLEFSWLALCGLLAFESLALQALLGEVQRLRTFRAPPMTDEDRRGGQIGDRIPEFSAELYSSGGKLTAAALLGTSHVVLFLKADDVRMETSNSMAMLVSYLLGKVEGRVYLFVRGEHQEARWVDERFGLQAVFGERINIVFDPNGSVANDFAVANSPQAVLIAADGRIQKFGWLDSRAAREGTRPPRAFMHSTRPW